MASSLTQFAIILILLKSANSKSAFEDCQTPDQQRGKCVIINHCPHLYSIILQNGTSNGSKDHLRRSHCGFESIMFPKVCCPVENFKLFEVAESAMSDSKYPLKCGLRTPTQRTDPWTALIEYEQPDGKRFYHCGGVLINKRYVLTSANCIKRHPKNAKLASVSLGDDDDEKSVPIEEALVHEDYDVDDSNQYNDVALVRLKRKISLKGGEIRPICLPGEKIDKYVGHTLPLSGWEVSMRDDSHHIKRTGIAQVWSHSGCNLIYNTTRVELGEGQLCVGGRKPSYLDSYRDLGGILMETSNSSYAAVGILSVRPSCCDRENYPRVYTKVAAYVEWIVNKLKP